MTRTESLKHRYVSIIQNPDNITNYINYTFLAANKVNAAKMFSKVSPHSLSG